MRFASVLAAPARVQQKEPVPFQELLPLKLKNRVSGKGDKTTDVACLQEMAILFACLKANEFDQALCSKEISKFQSCYTMYMSNKYIKKEQEMKGILTPGQKNLTHKQVNQMLKRFPNIK